MASRMLRDRVRSFGVSQIQLPFGNRDCQTVDGVAIAARAPGVGKFVAIAIVLDAVRCRPDLAAVEQ